MEKDELTANKNVTENENGLFEDAAQSAEVAEAEVLKGEACSNVSQVSDEPEADEGKKAKKPRKKWSKKKKVTIWSIVAAVLVIAIVVSSVTVKFTMFNDEFYSVDLEAIRGGTPIFVDEFDTFNENVWVKDENKNDKGEIIPRRGGWWLKEAVDVKDGNLVITTKKDIENDRWITGAVSATGTPGAEDENGNRGFSRTYGYYEARCKLPKGYGIWSAFWFMPTTANFGSATSRDASVWGSEIDVFEVPIWPQNKIQQAIHVGGYDEKLHTSTFNPRWLTFDKMSDIYDSYHTYGFYWNEDIYKFYIDGKCVWTTSYNNNVSKVDEYMIFSVEIGGKDGKLTENPWRFIGGKMINENKEGDYYQSEFFVDYVKVWDV